MRKRLELMEKRISEENKWRRNDWKRARKGAVGLCFDFKGKSDQVFSKRTWLNRTKAGTIL